MTPHRVVATRLIVDPHTKRTITAPAHILAPPRIKQSDITRYGSFRAARDAVSRRVATQDAHTSTTPADVAGRGNGESA